MPLNVMFAYVMNRVAYANSNITHTPGIYTIPYFTFLYTLWVAQYMLNDIMWIYTNGYYTYVCPLCVLEMGAYQNVTPHHGLEKHDSKFSKYQFDIYVSFVNSKIMTQFTGFSMLLRELCNNNNESPASTEIQRIL